MAGLQKPSKRFRPPFHLSSQYRALVIQNFLTLWKDADPDIPILKQAKAEYARLQ